MSTIHLNAEQKRVVERAIQAGLIRNADDVVDLGLETIRQRLQRLASTTAPDAEQWSQRLHAWVHSHSRLTPLLSDEAMSRDSIYETRGL
jgi:Arc/MetJ-type ribon-helix-helix transcriptional regulator